MKCLKCNDITTCSNCDQLQAINILIQAIAEKMEILIIEIVPPWYGNQYDKFTIKIPDNVVNIDKYLHANGIKFVSYEILT